MKQNTGRKLLGVLLALVLVIGLVPGMSMTALADEDSTYTITIPSTLNVANSGWNETAGISATGSLADGKKLTVTASSDGEYALVNQSDNTQKVSYKLAESGDTNTTFDNATEKTAWEFTELSNTASTQPMGIIVEDYSEKPAGNCTDTVTFTASVENSVTVTLSDALVNGGKIKFGYHCQWTGDNASE